jgi:hypothetical protein
VLLCVLASGCGGGGDGSISSDKVTLTQDVTAAANPRAADFPSAKGRTLQQLADLARPGPQFAPATSRYVVGPNRLAFGLVNQTGTFIYAPTSIYIGRTPNSPAQGPILAPSDSLLTEDSYRSQTSASEGDAIASIYASELNLPGPGRYSVLILTRAAGQLLGATAQIVAAASDPIPAPGDASPAIETDTLAKAGGQISTIDTRVPPDDMHSTDFADVIGKEPVALLFATPALCQSRVCGPVTDLAAQLKSEYGDRIEFIHQEVYVDNDANKGFRPPLAAFNLRTEPWLFTFDAQGRVAARLEGSFGQREFEQALQAAL